MTGRTRLHCNRVADMEEFDLDAGIAEWKAYLGKRAAFSAQDIHELEDHLLDQIERLREAGLEDEEAFLIAARRIGNLDAVAHEFAVTHSGRLWKNLVLSTGSDQHNTTGGSEFMVVLLLAVCAAVAIKLPALFGIRFDGVEGTLFYARNITLFCLPFLAAYFVWKRQLGIASLRVLAPPVLAALVVANFYPFVSNGSTEILSILHLPIAMWFVIGVVYTGDWWRSDARRMDFIRFSGEYAIYYLLIALGGGVLTGFTLGMFNIIGMDLETLAQAWIIPCGAMGAVLIAAWLVEAKQAAIENMAPVLTRVFTPLFTLLLLAFLVAMLVTGNGIDVQREVLIGFDLLLALVLGLVLYAVSSRDPGAPADWFDSLQLLLIISALLVDVLALLAISGRISDMGFTPNRMAALGENLVLLVSLGGYAWHYLRFVRDETGFTALEHWQTRYLPVYAGWAALVVLVFPPLFGFI